MLWRGFSMPGALIWDDFTARSDLAATAVAREEKFFASVARTLTILD